MFLFFTIPIFIFPLYVSVRGTLTNTYVVFHGQSTPTWLTFASHSNVPHTNTHTPTRNPRNQTLQILHSTFHTVQLIAVPHRVDIPKLWGFIQIYLYIIYTHMLPMLYLVVELFLLFAFWIFLSPPDFVGFVRTACFNVVNPCWNVGYVAVGCRALDAVPTCVPGSSSIYPTTNSEPLRCVANSEREYRFIVTRK